MPSLVEIRQMVLKKILNLGNVFLQLRNYFPLKKCVVFYLKKKIDSHHPRMLCAFSSGELKSQENGRYFRLDR